MRSTILVSALIFSQFGCSSIRLRVSGSAIVGGALGGMGGYAFSPDESNRMPNALVFGLAGALIGGACGLLWPDDSSSKAAATLKRSESGAGDLSRQITLNNPSELPDFLKERVQPTVIEEFTEKSSISEDGAIHEPHKVYRIKRPVELSAEPALQSSETEVANPVESSNAN